MCVSRQTRLSLARLWCRKTLSTNIGHNCILVHCRAVGRSTGEKCKPVMNSRATNSKAIGRGAGIDPPNRFERVRIEDDWEQLDADELAADPRRVRTQFLPNDTRRLITENTSPDVPFRYSINPYRGCEHGCAYCYAQPKSAQPENRAILLISACKLRSSWGYRTFSGVQEWPRGVPHG